MYFKQKDLLTGMDKHFIKELMEMMEKKSYKKGTFVFHEGNHASRFYMLLKGRIRLTVGTAGQVVFTISHAGEVFGWSSLLGRSNYAASAECTESTKLLRIDRVKFNMILEKDPANGLILIKRLAGMLGHRLNKAYEILASRDQSEGYMSFGSGQLMEMSPPV